jgi:WD40 repeat protein
VIGRDVEGAGGRGHFARFRAAVGDELGRCAAGTAPSATQKLLATFTDVGSSGVTTAAFSPDGQTLAAGDYNGKTYLWNLRTGTLVAALVNPGGTLAPVFKGKDRDAVTALAFSPDGKTLGASGTNGSAYLWRIR